jgi:hypothetical protein
VTTSSARSTSAFLASAPRLRHLHLDLWGGGASCLPRAIGACTALTSLRVQCSTRCAGVDALCALPLLADLEVADSDWQALPPELCALPLTRQGDPGLQGGHAARPHACPPACGKALPSSEQCSANATPTQARGTLFPLSGRPDCPTLTPLLTPGLT